MDDWIPVETPPPIGTWCNVLEDRQLEDYWGRRIWTGLLHKLRPRYSVHCAMLRSIDHEGNTEWVRWTMPSGYPIGVMYSITHYKMLPEPPEGDYIDEYA